MNTQHTPGPWNAKDSIVYSLESGKDVARCDIGGRDEETEANARLIASGPELLEALKEVIAFEKRGADKGEPRIGTGILNIIHRAIAKAEGKK